MLRLHSTLISHLRSQRTSKKARKSASGSESGQSYDPDAGNASRPGDGADATTTAIDVEEDADEETAAAKMLDRVKIMRVFDFVGVIEAIGEIRDELERPQAAPAESSPMPSSPPPMPREPGMRRTVSKIGDSEDEDEEDMLFDSAAEAPEPPLSPHVEPVTETVSEAPPERISSEESGPSTGKTGMIIIGNITHVLSPLMKTDYVQGPPRFPLIPIFLTRCAPPLPPFAPSNTALTSSSTHPPNHNPPLPNPPNTHPLHLYRADKRRDNSSSHSRRRARRTSCPRPKCRAW